MCRTGGEGPFYDFTAGEVDALQADAATLFEMCIAQGTTSWRTDCWTGWASLPAAAPGPSRRHRGCVESAGMAVTVADVRRLALSLPRTEEALVRDRVKFRVGRIVYLAFSADETLLGFAFPKEERAALVAAEPEKFLMPVPSDERYNWVRVRPSAIDEAEMRELVIDAWRMVVPKKVAAAYLTR